jgi:hypothetical protein
MEQAIATLEIAADNAENNAPIHAAEGNTAQAELSSTVAADCREAISILSGQEQAKRASFPEPGELIHATCMRSEHVSNGYLGASVVKSRAY